MRKVTVAREEDSKVLEYVKTKDPALLEEIVTAYMPFVRKTLSRVTPSFPVLDRDDLVQCGLIGFLGALRRFNPEQGVPFEAWATQRVRGAALDAVRKVSSTARTRDVQFIRLTDSYAYEDDNDLVDLGVPDGVSPSLRTALLSLPIRQAAILLLSINGMPSASIAGMIDKSEGVVYQERIAAIEYLRNELAETLKELV